MQTKQDFVADTSAVLSTLPISFPRRYTIAVAAVGKDGKHASYSVRLGSLLGFVWLPFSSDLTVVILLQTQTTGAGVFVSAPGGDFDSVSGNIVAKPGGGCVSFDRRTFWVANIAAVSLANLCSSSYLLLLPICFCYSMIFPLGRLLLHQSLRESLRSCYK